MEDLKFLGETINYKSPSGQVYSINKYFKGKHPEGLIHNGLTGKEVIVEVDIIKCLRKFEVK